MSNEPRRHHYLPQFYLSGFTDENGELWVFRVSDGVTYRGRPATVGHQRDFYRVDGVPGVEPNDLERGFAEFETKAATVIRSISEAKELPEDGDAFGVLINLVALMMARVPRTREEFSRPIKEVTKMLGDIIVSSDERFRASYERARREDPSLPAEVDYESVRKMVETEAYTIEVSQPYQLKQLLQIVDIVLPLLAQRLWSLIIAPAGTAFVTSDNPVALTWTHPPSLFGPGFGVPGTDVTFPLTQRLALLGRFEGPAETMRASRKQVASVNSRTSGLAQRFVCGASEDLVWLRRDGSIGNAAELVEALRKRQTEG